MTYVTGIGPGTRPVSRVPPPQQVRRINDLAKVRKGVTRTRRRQAMFRLLWPCDPCSAWLAIPRISPAVVSQSSGLLRNRPGPDLGRESVHPVLDLYLASLRRFAAAQPH